jgi:hypothetical protein
LDIGSNLDYCRRRFDFGTWIEHDLEADGPLPLDTGLLARSVLVCADVIEHLHRPERLLEKLLRSGDVAAAVLVSTPDRKRMATPALGPPANPGHVREWSRDELAVLLKASGFRSGKVTNTRPHTGTLARTTILAKIVNGDRQPAQ